MSTDVAKPFCLVVGMQFTEAGGYAVQEGIRIAQRIPRAALHLVHVVEDGATEEKTRDLFGHLRLYVNEKVSSVGGLSGATVGIHLRPGEPNKELVRFAKDAGADLVVVGVSKGHLGRHRESTSENLAAELPCPVVVAGPKPKPHAPEVPAIDPPCPDCVRAREATKNATWWCARHAEHAMRAHTYSYHREVPLRSHDSEVIPTGIDLR